MNFIPRFQTKLIQGFKGKMKIIDVDYLEQFLPGCPVEKNGCCGPASLTMCACYALGREPQSSDIVAVLAHLDHRLDGTGGGTRWVELLDAGENVFGLRGLTKDIWGIDEIRAEITAGRPMIIGLHSCILTNRGYAFSGGHYVAAVGFDDNHIICNDPMTRLNGPIYYKVSQMQEAMNAIGENIPNGVLHGFGKR